MSYDSLVVKEPVIVQKLYSTSKYEGTVKNIFWTYVNKGAKQHGKEMHVYVSFIDAINAYSDLLLIGSPLMCFINNTLTNCHTRAITRDNSNNIVSVQVVEEDSENITSPYPIVYTIPFDNIDSMLIYHKAYTIKRL